MSAKDRRIVSKLTLFVGALLLLVAAVASDNAAEVVATSEKVVKGNPIVIHTQVQDYEQPTLDDFVVCEDNRDKCFEVCETASNQTSCEAECPVCPTLIKQDMVVQGINDTDYRAPAVAATGNTTNIIKLTNEISNIIENNMGNITARNENNVHIYQNISSTGGKFGLGYNNNGSCCIVMRASSNCNHQQFSPSQRRCHHKRSRMCGTHCKSRVMVAKRRSWCVEPQGSPCRQTVVYVPHRRRRTTSNCQYSPHWPFVSCHGGADRHARCQSCYRLPYMVVMREGIPRHCMSCFAGSGGAMPNSPYHHMPYYGGGGGYMPQHDYYNPMSYNGAAWPPCYMTNTCYPQYAPPLMPPPAYGGGAFEYEELPPGDGWTVEQTKCRMADGTVGNCDPINIEDDSNITPHPSHPVTSAPPIEENPWPELPEAEDEVDQDYDSEIDLDNDYDLGLENESRHRRQSSNGFRRSRYSRRYRGY